MHTIKRAKYFPKTHALTYPRVLFDRDEHTFLHPDILSNKQVQVRFTFFLDLTFLNPFNFCKKKVKMPQLTKKQKVISNWKPFARFVILILRFSSQLFMDLNLMSNHERKCACHSSSKVCQLVYRLIKDSISTSAWIESITLE